MTYRPTLLLVVIAGILQTSLAIAQETPTRSRYALVPQIGELIPDLEIVDDQGKPVKLRELTQGHYTVMTLGCLT